MKKGRFESSASAKKHTKKVVALLLVMLLLVGSVVGTTLAYLSASTDPVVNTFTVGNIGLTLAETTGYSYPIVPGETYNKDPKITVTANSESCYVYVKVDKVDTNSVLQYDIADGWTELVSEGNSTVYYRAAATSASNQIFSVLDGDEVTIASTATGDQSATLTFTAYAFQTAGFDTAAEAWEESGWTPAIPAQGNP